MEHFKIPEETLNQAIVNTQVFTVVVYTVVQKKRANFGGL